MRGPLGQCTLDIASMDPEATLALEIRDTTLEVCGASHALVGFWRGRLTALVRGVTRGHVVSLELRGIGYRGRVHEGCLYLKLGLSHDVLYRIPHGIQVYMPTSTTMVLIGVDPAHVHQVAATLQACRPPSPYQHKGIYISGVRVSRKVGKRK